ncbi:hypothetical protein [Slackia heliotrinireducens]|uniref:hypothetical protein n=1 Tax=Slackia heliotrinireducens TaxID=84110 RepID=UPI003314EEE8
MTQYGMLIDTKRCVACGTCVVGCKVENNLPKDMWYNRVVNVGGENPDSPSGTYAARDLAMGAYTMACQHCSNPACVEVCPTRARIFGDLEDPESEISKKLAEREYEQLLTEAGTEPNVYLLK